MTNIITNSLTTSAYYLNQGFWQCVALPGRTWRVLKTGTLFTFSTFTIIVSGSVREFKKSGFYERKIQPLDLYDYSVIIASTAIAALTTVVAFTCFKRWHMPFTIFIDGLCLFLTLLFLNYRINRHFDAKAITTFKNLQAVIKTIEWNDHKGGKIEKILKEIAGQQFSHREKNKADLSNQLATFRKNIFDKKAYDQQRTVLLRELEENQNQLNDSPEKDAINGLVADIKPKMKNIVNIDIQNKLKYISNQTIKQNVNALLATTIDLEKEKKTFHNFLNTLIVELGGQAVDYQARENTDVDPVAADYYVIGDQPQ